MKNIFNIKNFLSIFVFVTLVVLAKCFPSLFLENTFINSFAGVELLLLSSVILTITLASVSNINLSITRILSSIGTKNTKVLEIANSLQKSNTHNAWWLFILFSILFVVLVIRGAVSNDSIQVHAFLNAVMIFIFIENLLVLLDIYQVTYGLIEIQAKHAIPHNED